MYVKQVDYSDWETDLTQWRAVGMGRWNYVSLSPTLCSNATPMCQGFADEAVVVLKRQAYDNHGDMV